MTDIEYLKKYYKYGLYKNFTVLLTHEGNPLIFTGLTEMGNREVVFAFDLHDSNLPLLIDYLVLTKNLLSYSLFFLFGISRFFSFAFFRRSRRGRSAA